MTTPFTLAPGRLTLSVTDEDHVIGPATAPATLVEYGDYQCPHCGLAHPAVQDLLRVRGRHVRYVFRHFPLTSLHPHAEMAAEAAEAAGARGRFWRMHDWLFDHQDRIRPGRLIEGVAALVLPTDEVIAEINNHVYLDRVQRDFAGGVRTGVRGTPTFFVNGERHNGGYSLPGLLEAVDRVLQASGR
jgi:protein-disulfide isomerase